MSKKIQKTVKVSSSSQPISTACTLTGFLLATDNVNNVTLTVYKGADNSGVEIIPTAAYRANLQGLNGVNDLKIDCPDGFYVEITTAGSTEIVFMYNNN